MGMDPRSWTDIMMSNSLVEEIEKHTILHEDGEILRGSCPLHGDSGEHLIVDEHRMAFHCLECDQGGTVFDFVRLMNRCSYIEAKEYLGGSAYYYPRKKRRNSPIRRTASCRRSTYGSMLFRLPMVDMRPMSTLKSWGIPSEVYLPLSNLRFQFLQLDGDGEEHEVLLAAVRHHEGEFQGLQRIYLNQQGEPLLGKLSEQPLGSIAGGAVQLGSDTTDIVICEGLTQGLTLRSLHPDKTIWAVPEPLALGDIPVPRECSQLTIAAENDTLSVMRAQHIGGRHASRDREILIMTPGDQYRDFRPRVARAWQSHRSASGRVISAIAVRI